MTWLIILLVAYFTLKIIYVYNKYKFFKEDWSKYNIKVNGKELGSISISKKGFNITIDFYDTEGNLIEHE